MGFTSSFAVVLQGLTAVGAPPRQAASGLTALTLAVDLGCAGFSWLRRQPITLAWSTPGAAMLAGAAVPSGGFSTAVGAFVLCGILLVLTGPVRPLARAMGQIPAPLASAMLAGVLLHLCVAPFPALVARPEVVAPVLLAWLVVRAVAPRWAVPAAVLAAGAVLAATGDPSGGAAHGTLPSVVPVVPHVSLAGAVSLAVPLYLVTMTSQNLPGVGVLAQYGYRLDPRIPLAYTGLASVAAAVLGGHAVNLAAISAALAAGPEAHPRADRRWVAGVTAGLTYLVLAGASGFVVALAQAAPDGLLAAVTGVALFATFGASASAALADPA